jgi:hypothetical protein
MLILRSPIALLLFLACSVCFGQKPLDDSISLGSETGLYEWRKKIVSYQNIHFQKEQTDCFEYDYKYTSPSNNEACHVIVDFDKGNLIASTDKWIIAMSPDYSFLLSKSGNSYSLLGVFPENTMEIFDKISNLYGGGTTRFLFPCLPRGSFKNAKISFAFTIGDTLASPSADLQNVMKNDNLITVLTKSIQKNNTVIPYTINEYVLDEKMHYAILRHTTQIPMGKNMGTIKTERKYFEQIEGLPSLLLKYVMLRSDYNVGVQAREETAHYSNYAKCNFPAEKLKLSYYGIPEPNFHSSPSRWPYYTFGLVAIFTIGYFVFKRYAAKR